MVAWKGYNILSSTIIIGAGTFFAITFSAIGVMEYFQRVEHTAFENTMVFVCASFLFDYGIFIIIYFFSYLNPSTKAETVDNFIIYYVSLMLSAFLTSYGLFSICRKSTKPARKFSFSIK